MPNQPTSTNTFFPQSVHPVGHCVKCGRLHAQLVFNNNPIIGAPTVCYDCVATTLDIHNLNHADLFCRTYNFPFDPEAWMAIVDDPSSSSPSAALRTYVEAALAEKSNQPNLAYGSATNDLWRRTTEEWKKCRDFAAILDRIQPIRDSYIKRSGMKWGEHYTFAELLKLDSIYVRTLRANNITNPLQQEAVRTLCKLLIEMDQAIAAKDAKAIKDFSDAWAKFAKQANLETMINESRTEDIVTMSELASYLEERNFMPSFYDNNPRDEVDRTIADLQDTQRRLIMESLSLQPV